MFKTLVLILYSIELTYGEHNIGPTTANLTDLEIKCSYSISAENYSDDIEFKCDPATTEVVPMNMILTRIINRNTNEFPFRPQNIPVNISFCIQLENLTKLPENWTITWNFGDDSGEKIFTGTTDLIVTHTYTKRDYFHFQVTITNSEQTSEIMGVVRLGIMDVQGHYPVGDMRMVKFNLSASANLQEDGIKIYGNWEDKEPICSTVQNSEIRCIEKFKAYGFYMPKFTFSNKEVLYLENAFLADYDLKKVCYENQLIFHHSPEEIPLPSGEAKFEIHLVNSSITELPYVTCTFDFGDEVNRFTFTKTQNISTDGPLSFIFTYIDLGNQTVLVNCSNAISSVNFSKEISVYNPCFGEEGIFDRQYSLEESPLLIHVSEDLYLSNRMNTLCFSVLPTFKWTVTCKENVPKNKTVSDKGLLYIQSGSLDPGLYYIILNVSLDTTFLYEYTYVKFVKLNPFAFIRGGNKIYVTETGVVNLNAMKYSHGYRGRTDKRWLKYFWTCQRIANPDVYHTPDYPDFETMNYNSNKHCLVNKTSTGKALLHLSDEPSDYKVTVKILDSDLESTLDSDLESTFSQIISFVDFNTGLTELECYINCNEKIAVTAKIAINSICSYCTDEDFELSYTWNVIQFNDQSNRYDKLMDIEDTTMNGKNEMSLSLKKNSLEEGKKYLIALFFMMTNREEKLDLFMLMQTNTPPRGGTCEILTKDDDLHISVRCSDWTKDGQSNVPLIYQFETVTKRRQILGDIEEEVINYLYRGSEDQIIDFPIQAGDPHFKYEVSVRVKIFDVYGDYGLFTSEHFTIAAIPPSKFTPSDENDVISVQNLLRYFEIKKEGILRGGNYMRGIRLIGSVASMFNASYNTRRTTREEDIMAGKVKEIYIDDDSKVTPVEKAYRNITKYFIDILLNEIGMNCESFSHRFSMTDIQLIFSTMDTFTRNSRYLTLNEVIQIINMTQSLMVCFHNLFSEFPLPPAHVDVIDDTVTQAHRIFDVLLDILLPYDLLDDEVELLEDNIYSILVQKEKELKEEENLLKTVNVSAMLNYTELSMKANLLYRVRNHEYNIQMIQKNITKEYISVIRTTLSNIQDVILRTIVFGEKHELHRRILSIVTEKISMDGINNRTDEHFLALHSANDTDKIKSNTGIDIKIAVFHKNPFIYGTEASTLTSSVSTFAVGNDIELDTILKNKQPLTFKKYFPLINYERPDKFIHFTFDVINDNDAAILYLKPDNFEVSGYDETLKLYRIYVREETHPTSSLYDIPPYQLSVRDRTENGFKIFIKAGVCGKGKCYVAIEPLPVANNDEKSRRKREAEQHISNSSFIPIIANFSLAVYTTGCRSWDANENKWDPSICTVLPMSTIKETICRCRGSVFSTTYFVPPNLINFLDAWSKFDAENASVYGTLVAIFVLFVMSVCLLRRQDKKDNDKWRIRFLCDHQTEYKYFYLLTVHTGMRFCAGTKSNINFIISGIECDSGVRCLSDGIRKEFETGSTIRLVMGTEWKLGDLQCLRIWHDNSGTGIYESWFLNEIEVQDLQTNQRFFFTCHKWFGIDKDDGMIERTIPVSSPEDTSSFSILFIRNTESQFTDNHLWLSLIVQTRKTSFTRVQRLSCLLAYLCLTMIANAMFFKSSSEGVNVDGIQIAFIELSYLSIYVSFIGTVITIPPIFVLTIIFRNRKPSDKHPEKNKRMMKYKLSNSADSNCNLNEIFEEKSYKFPSWTVYIAYGLIFLASTSSAFFLVLYSMEWGKAKSNEWLISFMLSFFDSVFVCDPIKVVILATMLSVIFKREETSRIDISKLAISSLRTQSNTELPISVFAKKILVKHDPIPKDTLLKIRKRRQEENEAKKAFKNLVIYIVYITALFNISFLQRDQLSSTYKENIDNYLISNNREQFGFSAINQTKDFIRWLNKTFIPTLYPNKNAAGQELGIIDKQWFGDFASIRVGPPRLRQLRMKEGACAYKALSKLHPCINSYAESDEDTNFYCVSWDPYDPNRCESLSYINSLYTAESWKYTDASSVWGVSRTGEFKTYSGGGYIVRFGRDRYNADKMLQELIDRQWFDRSTRGVFTEFTLYNPNINVFLYALFLVEFPETGGSVTWTDVQAFRPTVSIGQLGNLETLSYLIILIYFIITVAKIVLLLKRTGFKKFFGVSWNYVECICAIVGGLCITFYAIRVSYAKEAMKIFYDDKLEGKNTFINFSHIVIWDNTFNSVLAVLVFMSTLQFIRILEYNKRITQIITVVTGARRDMFGFAVVFVVMFMAFAIVGTLLFGSKLNDYRNVLNSCGSLTNSFIGKNKVDSMITASPNAAKIFFFFYTMCIAMTLLTIFISILNESISATKRAATVTTVHSYGVLDHLCTLTKGIYKHIFKRELKVHHKRKGYNQTPFKGEALDTNNTFLLLKMVLDRFTNQEKSDKANEKWNKDDCQEKLQKSSHLKTYEYLNRSKQGMENGDQSYVISKDIALSFL